MSNARSQGDDRSSGTDRPHNKRGWGRRHPILMTFVVLAVLTLVVPLAVVGVAYSRVEVPTPGSISTNQISEIYASDETTLLGRIVPPEGNRTEVTIDQVPVHVRNAVIAAEDRTFYTNEGFDPTGIGRAVWGQITGESTAGGGSTITQQYVKNTMVGNEVSYERKFNEILIAAKMTGQWSKDEILAAYLNTIYFGRGAYGIDAASRAYFNKPVENLTVEEGAVLAGTIQSPSALDPMINRAASEQRWSYVLNGMRDMGAITADQRASAVFPQVVEDPQSVEQNVGDPTNGAIRRQVLAELALSGIDEQMLNTSGLRITTTIDVDTQASVVDAARSNMEGENQENRTAVVSINPKTGGVIGYYGGEDPEGWDYANAPLQTGSTFKIFAVAAALDQGIPLSENISSAPVQSGSITVTNAGGMTCGTCSIAQALKLSLNTSFIRLQRQLENGTLDTQEMAYRAGIPKRIPGLPYDTLTEQGEPPYDGIVLGQYPIRVRDMATGIATFAAEGVHRPTHFIQRVEAADGEVLLDNSELEGEQVIDKDVANNLTSAMEPIAAYSKGHGLAAGRPSAAKSGTTQLGDTGYNKDAWFVGYTPSIATAVWVGTDDNQPLFNAWGGIMYGADVPADIWKSAMDGALADSDWEDFPEPGMVGGQSGRPLWESYSGGQSNNQYTYQPQAPSVAPEVPDANPDGSNPPTQGELAPGFTLEIPIPGVPDIILPGTMVGEPQDPGQPQPPAQQPPAVPVPQPDPNINPGNELGGG